MKTIAVARGFRFAGIHAGVKIARKDLALIVSDAPASAAGCVTQNRLRAACTERTARLLPASGIRAVVVNSGNANCMAGPAEVESDQRMAATVAKALGVGVDSVLSASTGSIGDPLPIERIEAATPALVEALSDEPHDAAEAILTTDRVSKLASRTLEIDGRPVVLTAIAKGSGMIHPNMATMLAFLCTDAACRPEALAQIVQDATAATFNQVSVDRDTSTNDTVAILANGLSGVEVDAKSEPFVAAVHSIFEELAREIAADGEGATRLVAIHVVGAPDLHSARELSRAAVASNLFKCSVFGDSSGWGRCLAALGARAAEMGIALDPQAVSLQLNGQLVVERGAGVGSAAAPQGPEVVYEIDLHSGQASAWAWGCDLSYDYVSINAVTKSEPLQTHSPGLKRRLLVEALTYIKRFSGRLAVIKYGGAAMIREELKDAFAEDLVLLCASGLLPVVVHGGGPEISLTLERLGETTRFVDGMRVTDAGSMKVVEMVLTGSVNTDVVTRIHKLGGRAIGLSGKDGALLTARKLRPKGLDLGQVGEVAEVQTEILRMLLDKGYIPVISPIGVDAHGATYNINADLVAAEVAVALGSEKLIYLTDVPGILRDGSLVSRTSPGELRQMIADGVVAGGMVPKVESILSALDRGVHSAQIIDGRVAHNLLAELFTDQGVGTMVSSETADVLHPRA